MIYQYILYQNKDLCTKVYPVFGKQINFKIFTIHVSVKHKHLGHTGILLQVGHNTTSGFLGFDGCCSICFDWLQDQYHMAFLVPRQCSGTKCLDLGGLEWGR